MKAHSERPIETPSEDELDRARFVERLEAAVINPSTNRSTGIVIGITGPWGSGKSSVLNMLQKRIEREHDGTVVVRFDPWLVSGRNDLITEFMAELISSIKKNDKLRKRLKGLASTIVRYGAQLAPAANYCAPGIGSAAQAGLKAIEEGLSSRESLHALREQLVDELGKAAVPIVVLIDEVDRIEDDEVRAVAQLVRAVADFTGISYVLAYDQHRVIQALGSGAGDAAREERGRAYLEKIVQLQLPLPLTFGNEIERLLTSELNEIQVDIGLPANFREIERYTYLSSILIEHVIATPRDIKRLVGAIHAIGGMVRGEVDPIDLVAYCALLIKAPATIDKLRADPEMIVEDTPSIRAATRRIEWNKKSCDDRMTSFVPKSEDKEGARHLMAYLFPAFQDRRTDREYADALCLRRSLLTVLRLGLIPGALPRADIEALMKESPADVTAQLRAAYENDTLVGLIDRLDDLYADFENGDALSFWSGVGAFLRKDDPSWMASYAPMHEVVRAFAQVLSNSVRRRPELRASAGRIFSLLKDEDEIELTSHLLRDHAFVYGLFGCRQSGGDKWFLTVEQTETATTELCAIWREMHLEGNLLPYLWDLHPVYMMVDTGSWDEECRAALDSTLSDDRALDGFTLMLYGAHYTTGRETVEKMCSYDAYSARVNERLSSHSIKNAHETLRVALHKAANGGWPGA